MTRNVLLYEEKWFTNNGDREEVKKAVWACGIDKAPGFDRYNFKFIREMWEVIKDEIYESVMEFFIAGHSVRHLNVTWVTLIPKVENPTSIEDYMPISMTLDGVLIVNESLRWLNKKKKIPGTLIKLDFQKAYDSVNWSFLELVMEKLGFGRKWIRWIMNCVSTASMSILLNGSPLQPFKMEKGLRQGDPLSPYLFILVSEALVYILKKAHDMNLIEAVCIGKAKVSLKHLQFAYDTLIFAPKYFTCITNYFRILDVFAMMFGLSLNYSKSSFISWNLEDHAWASDIARSVGCIHSCPPFTYLGFPLGDHMNRCSVWKLVVKKIESRLASWKTKLLSRARRLTLIKSVLNSLPIYYMSMFKMSKGIALKIVKLQRRFFWGRTNGESMGCPMVKWSDIELSREMGGVRVGNIMHKNLILLFKWWSRFSESDNTLWKRILQSVHEIKGVKASSETFRRVREGTWSYLLNNDSDTSRLRMIIEEGMLISVGIGNSVQFWHDRWCEAGILKRIFPRLFTISLQKNSLISQMGEWNEISWVWNLKWRRVLYEWENEEVRRLKEIIVHKGPNKERKDGVYWKHSGSLCYPTKCITAKINEVYTPFLPRPIVNIVWQKFIPPRAKLSVWLANLEKLKTGDFLVEKGIINPQEAACPFCSLQLESNSHILFTCRFSWSAWMEILKWWGLSTALHNRYNKFSIQWLGLVKNRMCPDFWALILGCVIRSLWYERNQIKFKLKIPNFHNFVYSLKIRIGIWAKEMLGPPLCCSGWTAPSPPFPMAFSPPGVFYAGWKGDNVHHREQCYKESIVVDNVHQHNYKDDEMCINIIMRMTRYASMKIGEKCSIDDCL
ncbi:uncharacterized protein LOC130799411 [Amaranthus tricolor]|uniref:uncharacterized protein LOC130799411 n=1 Tax=Amaranthus tricolor TaxID=29722 RepID=UPI0025855E10|nr:uncharacterized protein LOC130799411 [Amaranthus tricolor]